jgi:hypothetical protein
MDCQGDIEGGRQLKMGTLFLFPDPVYFLTESSLGKDCCECPRVGLERWRGLTVVQDVSFDIF